MQRSSGWLTGWLRKETRTRHGQDGEHTREKCLMPDTALAFDVKDDGETELSILAFVWWWHLWQTLDNRANCFLLYTETENKSNGITGCQLMEQTNDDRPLILSPWIEGEHQEIQNRCGNKPRRKERDWPSINYRYRPTGRHGKWRNKEVRNNKLFSTRNAPAAAPFSSQPLVTVLVEMKGVPPSSSWQ